MSLLKKLNDIEVGGILLLHQFVNKRLEYDFVEGPRSPSPTPVKTLNEIYSSLSTGRRYEVWFVRLGLADGAGAWWFRYLLMNPGRGGCPGDPRGMPVQVWATLFPRDGKPQSFIQGFPLEGLNLSIVPGETLSSQDSPPKVDERCCVKPRNGVRMQPTAQAVGTK